MKVTAFIVAMVGAVSVNAADDDSYFIVNSRRGNEVSSGVAWYSNRNNAWGRQPQNYVDVEHGVVRKWEGQQTEAYFKDGSWFKVNIDHLGYDKAAGEHVGFGWNKWRSFNCYKTHNRAVVVPTLYRVEDWNVQGIYECK
ncbi:hypothetical protein FNYG_02838 [Fusarium nygamai]|uniref:Uncharacterized protein n=1 Tax=Gibberella nygamai TaxID=42673 RepID=A0A2K0WPE7_GIBNY|nr:hypothetical protein FNYG_02838 [Fusarium nygamai]